MNGHMFHVFEFFMEGFAANFAGEGWGLRSCRASLPVVLHPGRDQESLVTILASVGPTLVTLAFVLPQTSLIGTLCATTLAHAVILVVRG